MKINNIFTSIQGEGNFQGFPTLFLRLFGCNLKCKYCDAKEAVFGNNFFEKTALELTKIINDFQGKHICITGGEPLLQEKELTIILSQISKSKIVSIETNGSLSIKNLSHNFSNIFFSVDWKTPASGNSLFLIENIDVLNKNKGWIKFVVENEDDFSFIEQKLNLLQEKDIDVFVSPVFEKDKEWFLKTEEFCLKHNLRFQLQLHKILGVE
jgi:7-carboxy-7-deazaguanine synthase